jgi:hypothetical protein
LEIFVQHRTSKGVLQSVLSLAGVPLSSRSFV